MSNPSFSTPAAPTTLIVSPTINNPSMVLNVPSVAEPVAVINNPSMILNVPSVAEPVINNPSMILNVPSVAEPVAVINNPSEILNVLSVAEPVAVINNPSEILNIPSVAEPVTTTKILTAPAIEPETLTKRGKTRGRTETPKKNVDHQIYVVHSQSPLSVVIDEIKRHIPEDLKSQPNLIGPFRIVFSRREETDRTICVFDRRIYAEMKRQGLTAKRSWADFRVVPFRLRDKLMPKQGQRHLYMVLPDQLTITDAKSQLKNMLEILSNFGIIKPDTYQILVPFKSRDSDDHVGKCFIVWGNGVTSDEIAMARIIINDSRWLDSEGYSLTGQQGLRRCYWSRIVNPKNIKMSPADRSYTHNHSEQRRNKIQRHDYKSRDRHSRDRHSKDSHSRKHFSPKRNNAISGPARINKQRNRISSFDFVISDAPQMIRNTVQPVYEPLSLNTQPIPVRGHMAPSQNVNGQHFSEEMMPSQTGQELLKSLGFDVLQNNVVPQPLGTTLTTLNTNQPIFPPLGNPEVVSVNTAKLI